MLPYDDPVERRRDRNRFLALWSAGLSGGASGGMLALGTAAVFRGIPLLDVSWIGVVLGVVPGLLATAIVGTVLAARRPPGRHVATWPEVLAVAGTSAVVGGVAALAVA